MRRSGVTFFVVCAAATAAFLLSPAARGATVTWSAPTTVAGDTDVITTGTLVAARNFSQTQLAPTVNGVLFDIFPIPNGSPGGAAGIPNVATLSYFDSESSDTAYGSASAPFNALSASYQTLLSSGAGSSTGASLTLTLLNLTNGTPYLVQLWSNDSGLAFGGVNSTTASATNSVILDENTTNAVGAMGQWAVGSFTASGTTQTITLSGVRPEINAFQLRAVPEPGTLVLGTCGVLCLGFFAGRRRRG